MFNNCACLFTLPETLTRAGDTQENTKVQRRKQAVRRQRNMQMKKTHATQTWRSKGTGRLGSKNLAYLDKENRARFTLTGHGLGHRRTARNMIACSHGAMGVGNNRRLNAENTRRTPALNKKHRYPTRKQPSRLLEKQWRTLKEAFG